MPKTKKKDSSSDSDSGPEDRNPPTNKKLKESSNVKTSSSNVKTSSSGGDGNKQWTLEKLRQVRINEFRGRKMVDIREFYEKNGDILPGKKGISLSATQWKKLLEVADEVTKALED